MVHLLPGTVQALTLETKYWQHQREQGLNMGGCGDQSIRLRPTLLFEKEHADIFLGILESVLNKL